MNGIVVRKLSDIVGKGFRYLGKSGPPNNGGLRRLVVQKAKWHNNADSPVMLMIDDFTNAWVKGDGSSDFDARGDWGGGHKAPHSIFSFLETNLYSLFPEIRTTFFTVVGKISHYTLHQPFTFAEPVNHDKASVYFFEEIFADERFEMAYHGFNHGAPGKTTLDFIQEWKGFTSIDTAMRQIREGLDIYQSVFGVFPGGGKYGGWEYNDFSDKTIDLSGFRWWCRDWMPKDITGAICKEYYEPQIFGENRIIALPSTIHGRQWTRGQIDRLLTDRQIISIEEHIGALRPDGLIQTPNVYDDINRLKRLFSYLERKNVWHAKGSEIAGYVDAYLNTTIYDIGTDSFRLLYSGINTESTITLLIQPMNSLDMQSERVSLICPDGSAVFGERSTEEEMVKFNLRPLPGEYRLKGF